MLHLLNRLGASLEHTPNAYASLQLPLISEDRMSLGSVAGTVHLSIPLLVVTLVAKATI